MMCSTVVSGHAAAGYRCMDPVQRDDPSPTEMLDAESTTEAVHCTAAGCDVSRLADVTDQPQSSQEALLHEAALQEATSQEAIPQEAKPGTSAWRMGSAVYLLACKPDEQCANYCCRSNDCARNG